MAGKRAPRASRGSKPKYGPPTYVRLEIEDHEWARKRADDERRQLVEIIRYAVSKYRADCERKR